MGKRLKKKLKVSELISLIPNHLYKDLSEVYSSDKWVKKLKTEVVFKLVLYSLISSERLSLRVMERHADSAMFELMAKVCLNHVVHTAIRARLLAIPSTLFADLHEHVYDQLSQYYSPRQLGKYHLKRYDSTMVATFAHLIEGMRVGNSSKGKRQIKYSTELKNDGLIRVEFFSDQAYLSEEVALAQLIEQSSHQADEIIVFDRGIRKRDTLVELSGKVPFVTRLNANARYELVQQGKVLPQDTDKLHFVQDSIVLLFKDGNHKVEHPFRLIEAHSKEGKETLFFLTNITDLKADQIAQLYKHRWEIEVLFKFLKQEMNLNHLISSEVNAIESVLYITLIAAMLILIYMAKNNFKSYKQTKIRFFNELQATLLIDFINTQGGVDFIKERFQYYIDYG